jgi:diamine N-acetyltransferase
MINLIFQSEYQNNCNIHQCKRFFRELKAVINVFLRKFDNGNLPSTVLLTTDMVELRDFNWDHVDTHFKWNNDEGLNFNDSDYPLVYESFESFSKRIKQLSSPDNISNRIFEIFHISDSMLIGVVDIHNIDPINKRCFVEATIGDINYRDKGYGRQAFSLAVDYCFRELKLHKVCTSAFDFNEKWINIVEGMGFAQEGELREHTLKNGKYCNKLLFGLLETEYAETFAVSGDYSTNNGRRTG